MKTKISIIVPVYNTELYLEKCLDSLVGQTLKEIEIILINDGSTDKSEQIIKKYQKKYNDKITYYSKKNEGQGVARNYAIKLAKGEFVTFVDSDDFIDISMCEKLYKKAKETNADVVATTGMIEVRNNEFIKRDIEFKTSENLKTYVLNNSGPVGKIIKKDIILQNDLYFPSLRAYEDIAVVPLWGIYSNKISYVDEALYYYLIHEGSTMKQIKYNEKIMDIYESLSGLYNQFKLKVKDKYNDELEWIYIEHLLHAASLRFYKFNKLDEIRKINKIMKEKFPKWKANKYYKKQSLKYKIVCSLISKEHFWLLRLILKSN